MELTRENSIQMWATLNSLANVKTSAKGAYGIAKNKRILEVEKDAIQKAQQAHMASSMSDDLRKFEEERVELCKEYADKDEDGNPITSNNQFKVVERNAEFIKALNELREEPVYAAAIKAREDKDNEFQNFMKESIEVEVHLIKVDDLPNDITAQQIEALGDLVTE